MKYFLLASLLLLLLSGCSSDSDNPTPTDCNDTPISVMLTNSESAACGVAEGFLEISTSGATGKLTYSLDEINFQNEPRFEQLTPGQYITTAKDENGCTGTLEVILNSMISFSEKIQPIIETNCAISGCHVSGAQAPDLSDRANIFSAAPRIKSQVETRAMPLGENRSLNDDEIASIICWFNDGAPDN